MTAVPGDTEAAMDEPAPLKDLLGSFCGEWMEGGGGSVAGSPLKGHCLRPFGLLSQNPISRVIYK